MFAIFFVSHGFAQQNAKDSIINAFESYKSAILNDDGAEAVKFVDSRTIDYYDEILNKSISADSASICSMNLMDRLMVISIKYRTSRENLLSFNGRDLFIYAIESGMVGKGSVINSSIGKVSINKDFATGEFFNEGEKTPMTLHFYRENSEWKIDLTSLFPLSEMALKQLFSSIPAGENEYIIFLLETMTNAAPYNPIWQPIRAVKTTK